MVAPLFGFAQKQVQTIIQQGHGESVKAVALSHSGKYLLSASRDRTIKLWDINTAYEIRTFHGHLHTVNSLDWSKDDKFMASGSADMTAKVWEVATGKVKWTSPKLSRYVCDVAMHPTQPWVAVASFENQLKIWDWKHETLVTSIEVDPDLGSKEGVYVAFSPDGKWLAIGQDGRLAQVYSTANWTEKWSVKMTNGSCGGCPTQVAFSPDNKYLLKMNDGASLDQFDLATGELVKRFKDKLDDPTSVNYDATGEYVTLTTEDSLFIFKANGELISAHKPTEEQVNDGIMLDEQTIILAEDQGLVLAYNIQQSIISKRYEGVLNQRDFGGLVHDLSNYWQQSLASHIKYKNEQLLVADKWLLRGKMGTKGVLWDLTQGKPTRELVGHSKGIICFDYSKENDAIVTGAGGGEVIRWEGSTGKEMMRYKRHNGPIFDVAFSHDGKKMASCSWDGLTIIWDVASGKPLNQFYFKDVSVYELAFTQNDEYLILGLLNKKVELWDIASETKVKEYIGHTEIVTSIEVLSDNEFMTTSKDGKAFIWNMGFGLKQKKIAYGLGAIHAQLWLPNPKRLLTAGADGIIRLWSEDLQSVERKFIGHQNEVTALNLSPDGKKLYSLDLDGVTKVWDLETTAEIYEFIQLSKAEWLIKSPEGFFNGTPHAMKSIHFVKGMKSYSLEQFFDVFYQPSAISNLLTYGRIKQRGDIEEVIAKLAPPEMKILAFPNEEQTEAEVYLKVTGKGVKDLHVQHNGKRLPLSMKALTIYKKDDKSVTYKAVLPLISGQNEFTCRAVNRDDIESAPVSTNVFSKNTKPGADCYIVSIGINQYKNGKLNLNYAEADASAFSHAVQKYSKGMYRNVYAHSLHDEKATKTNILTLLDSLSKKVTINDVFIFYYAGHGSVVEDNFFFVTYEVTQLYAELERMHKTALSEDEMMRKFQDIKALKQMVVMDACHSGSAVEKLANRGAMREKAIAQLSRSSGVHVLASAGSEQYATEYDSLGHGLFTYCLIEALEGKADGAPADKKVTLFEIKSFLHDQVPNRSMELKGSAQYPFTFSRGHDFPLVIEQKEEEDKE